MTVLLPFLAAGLTAQAYPFTIVDDVYGPDPVVHLKVLVRLIHVNCLDCLVSCTLNLDGAIRHTQKNLRTGENMSVCYSSGGGVEELYLGSNLRKVSLNSTQIFFLLWIENPDVDSCRFSPLARATAQQCATTCLGAAVC